MKQLPVRMPDELYDTVKGVAQLTDQSMNKLAVDALRAYVARDDMHGVAVHSIVERAQGDYREVLEKLKDM